VPIEKRPGEFRYRVTANIRRWRRPRRGHRDQRQDRREYTAEGKKRSYVAARCSDHILRSHGAFTSPTA